MTQSSWLAAACSLLLLACGPVHAGGADAGVDAHTGEFDAGDDGPPNPDAAAPCTLAESTPGPTEFGGVYVCGAALCPTPDPAAAQLVQVVGLLNSDDEPDTLAVELYSGYGPFADGITSGVFSLSEGAEANYSTCGACISVWTDMDVESGARTDVYYQTGGTLTITSLIAGDGGATPATVTGSVSGLTVAHVTIDDGSVSTLVGDCSTTVSDFDFTAEITDNAAR